MMVLDAVVYYLGPVAIIPFRKLYDDVKEAIYSEMHQEECSTEDAAELEPNLHARALVVEASRSHLSQN